MDWQDFRKSNWRVKLFWVADRSAWSLIFQILSNVPFGSWNIVMVLKISIQNKINIFFGTHLFDMKYAHI